MDTIWIPAGITYNVVPGLERILTYTQPKYTTLTALQNAITNINNKIQTESNNLEIPNQGNLNVSKDSHYHTSLTYYTFQRNNTIHKYGNRGQIALQQTHFTYQRKGNQELQIQALNIIVADLQNQINNITSNNPPNTNEPEVCTI